MIIVYDFDKTLTDRDTLFGFYKFQAFKSVFYYCKILIYFACMLLAKIKLISNDRLKNIGIQLFLKNLSDEEFKSKCENYKHAIAYNFLYENTNFSKLENTYIISASFEDYIKPIFPKHIQVVGSKLNPIQCTLSFNCYGQNKVAALAKFDIREIDIFYTDSISDLPLVKMAKKTILVKKNKLIECRTINEFIRNAK
jgi:phosphoserine phosphatase